MQKKPSLPFLVDFVPRKNSPIDLLVLTLRVCVCVCSVQIWNTLRCEWRLYIHDKASVLLTGSIRCIMSSRRSYIVTQPPTLTVSDWHVNNDAALIQLYKVIRATCATNTCVCAVRRYTIHGSRLTGKIRIGFHPHPPNQNHKNGVNLKHQNTQTKRLANKTSCLFNIRTQTEQNRVF